MFLTTHPTLLKASWASVVLASVLLTAGCNKTATNEAVDDGDVAVAEKTTTAPVKAAENEKAFVMTTLGLDAINNMVFTPLVNSDKLNAEQKACLESRDKELGQTQLQGFYKSNFSEAELKELDTFYSSSVGQKMLTAGKEEMLLRNGGEVANPMAAPTPEEISEIQTFMQTPTGTKYAQMNIAVGEGSALATLDKPIDAEFKRCNIDLTMAQLMQPTAPAVAPAAG